MMKKMNAGYGRMLMIVCAALLCASPCLAEIMPPQITEFPNTPRNRWAYEALRYLIERGLLLEGTPIHAPDDHARALTRYEFAVVTVRVLQNISANSSVGPMPLDNERATVLDVLAALRREFAREIADLGIRDPLSGRSPSESHTPVPPRLIITPSTLHRAGSVDYVTVPSPDFVPRDAKNKWVYQAFEMLNRAFAPEGTPQEDKTQLLTRWRFAFAIAHLSERIWKLDGKSTNPIATLTQQEVSDLFVALRREFAGELRTLEVQQLYPDPRNLEQSLFPRPRPNLAPSFSVLHRALETSQKTQPAPK